MARRPCKEAVHVGYHMLERGGAIVNISSVIGQITGRGFAAYGTAKAAMSHFTRLLAEDLCK